jgi:hypothetical protein
MKFVYLFGDLGLLLFWLGIFFHRKDLHKPMIYSGLVLLPLSVTEFFFIPQYWEDKNIQLPTVTEIPFEEVKKAHYLLEHGKTVGKLVLTTND